MTTQPESILEANLVKQLIGLKYEPISIPDEAALLRNLKAQLERHNQVSLSDTEFKRILNHLSKGNVFEKAKTLRDKYALPMDDGTTKYIEFLDSEHWCQNIFQVTQQVTIEGTYKNRYDVTILINGLPLVQIELKRRGLELKEAFNQINRYQRHSFGANIALFQYVQLFVISNGVNTKYYANNRKQSFKQTFFWADKDNQNITNLPEFTDAFLEPCHLSKMICKYIVLAETAKVLMVLRPYQYYAAEAIVDRVINTHKNGYIWHTTGSGKTLTSFKAAQVLMKLPNVHKVVFVVDRKDLDYQTTKEFNSFSDGSVDGTNNTQSLVRQLSDDTKLIVTTLQKLNTAIGKQRYLSAMETLKDQHIVFIFDECHRSQFGETHKSITDFFTHCQMIGFTGTPIFAENVSSNALGKRTTEMLFGDCLHKYVITDAISDENVLKFSVEYVGRYREKTGSRNSLDIEVEDIDTKELLDSPQRIGKIVDYIIDNHDRKTHNRTFTAMLCVSSVDALSTYYEVFKQRQHSLKIATIFSYSANEDDKDANGYDQLDESDLPLPEGEGWGEGQYLHSRDRLESYIGDYNTTFGTNFTTKDSQSFYNYYNDIAKRVKDAQIDILLVVNMFLTGFDSKTLNTLYVDKNLKYHGLIQAFSRTNRILNEQKSQGNIVCFRNLKQATDDAIALFSNKNASSIILMQPYEDYVAQFLEALTKLKELTPTVDSVNLLISEEEKLAFVKAFRDLIRLKNVLSSFADFRFDDVSMPEQEFEDYKSKYLDIHDSVTKREGKEKASILEDVDFELELIHQDDINVSYILKLLNQYQHSSDEEKQAKREQIVNILSSNPQLRSKRELIEQFIDSTLATADGVDAVNQIEDAFDVFWESEKNKAFVYLCEEEQLLPAKVQEVIETYLYEQRPPLKEDIANILAVKPKLLERKTLVPKVRERLMKHIERFYDL